MLSVCFLVVCAPYAASAATITAASCSLSDVQAAVRRAGNGDTVQVPPGTCSWTGGIGIAKAIHLKASGAVTIINNNPARADLVGITESTAGPVRLSGFTWQNGVGPNTDYGNGTIGMYPEKNGKPILIDHNTFIMTTSGNAIRSATNKGVIWANTFTAQVLRSGCYCNNASALRHKLNATQNFSWTTPSVWGSADTNGDQNLYFEGNTLKLVQEGIDVDDNARTIIRYNTFENSPVVHHGADTSGSGGRYSEIYNNSFIWNPNALPGAELPPNVNAFIAIRGGTTLVHNNVIQDITGAAWGDKSEVQLLIENPWRNAGPYACWKEGYPVPHQPGWGYTTGAVKRTAEVSQDSEPIYFWGNTGTGNYTNPSVGGFPDECRNNPPPPDSFVQANRDYFTDRAKPGYTPSVYPHPLVSSASQ